MSIRKSASFNITIVQLTFLRMTFKKLRGATQLSLTGVRIFRLEQFQPMQNAFQHMQL